MKHPFYEGSWMRLAKATLRSPAEQKLLWDRQVRLLDSSLAYARLRNLQYFPSPVYLPQSIFLQISKWIYNGKPTLTFLSLCMLLSLSLLFCYFHFTFCLTRKCPIDILVIPLDCNWVHYNIEKEAVLTSITFIKIGYLWPLLQMYCSLVG